MSGFLFMICILKFNAPFLIHTYIFTKIVPTEIPAKTLSALSNVYKFVRTLFDERRKRWDTGEG